MSIARDASLEQLIAAKPDDPEGYLVYADWLSTHGDPRGELILVQHQMSNGADLAARERAILAANERFLPGADPTLVAVTWRWGFLQSVHFNNTDDWMIDELDTPAVVESVFSSPVARVLEELRVGILRWEHCEEDVPAILAGAMAAPAGKELRKIVVGDFGEYDVDTAMFSPGKLSFGAFPALESLRIHCSGHSFGDFDLPKLKSLVIETCSFRKEHLAALFAAAWPALERADLWFGAERYNANCSVDDLTPILDGTAFPAIQHLGLMNAEFADSLPATLARSKVLPRLRTLDLSKGTMGPDGARALLGERAAFAHLDSISLDDNFLDDEVLAELEASGLPIVTESQKEDDLSVPGEVHRYVSLAE